MRLFRKHQVQAGGIQPSAQSLWANTKKQFRKNKLAVYSWKFIKVLVLIALLADLLANEKPLACSYNGKIYFPVFRSCLADIGLAGYPAELQNVNWRDEHCSFVLFPPVPYSPTNFDSNNEHSVSPLGPQHVPSLFWRHWLGTDELGHDVLSIMIHGTRISLLVGLVAMSIAAFIGILLGSLAGYFGDERLQASRARLLLNILFFLLALFYGFAVRSYILSDALAVSFGSFIWELLLSLLVMAGIIATGNLLAIPLKRIPFLGKRVKLPVDITVSRLFEVMLSIPTLFLIISVSAVVSKPSIFLVMAVIGLTSWTGIARFMRAELLRVRSLEYIEAAHALGFSEWRIIFRHAIPNALSPVLIAIAFGIAAAILIESTLSFLGIGVPPELLTWGSLLSSARQTPNAWWVALFPGIAIFITVTIYNLVGEGLTDALDPKKRKL